MSSVLLGGEKEKKFVEEIKQLRTELQARKVMLKVAEDEVSFTKNKLQKAESHAKQVNVYNSFMLSFCEYHF